MLRRLIKRLRRPFDQPIHPFMCANQRRRTDHSITYCSTIRPAFSAAGRQTSAAYSPPQAGHGCRRHGQVQLPQTSPKSVLPPRFSGSPALPTDVANKAQYRKRRVQLFCDRNRSSASQGPQQGFVRYEIHGDRIENRTPTNNCFAHLLAPFAINILLMLDKRVND